MNPTDPNPDPKPARAERIRAIQAQIAELKKRWPPHSVPPQLMREMDELEEELELLGGSGG
jgi:hypothetical protein